MKKNFSDLYAVLERVDRRLMMGKVWPLHHSLERTASELTTFVSAQQTYATMLPVMEQVLKDKTITAWVADFDSMATVLHYFLLHFKTHRQYYYELLNRVRTSGDWESWLDFFAEAVIITATQAVETAQQLLDLSNKDREKISTLGRATASTLRVHRTLMEHPIVTSGWLVKKTGITAATVNKTLGHLVQLGIVRELTAKKRNRFFSYTGYIGILNRGTELPMRTLL